MSQKPTPNGGLLIVVASMLMMQTSLLTMQGGSGGLSPTEEMDIELSVKRDYLPGPKRLAKPFSDGKGGVFIYTPYGALSQEKNGRETSWYSLYGRCILRSDGLSCRP